MSGIKLSNDNNAGVTVRELTRLERIGAHSHIRGLGLDGKSFFLLAFAFGIIYIMMYKQLQRYIPHLQSSYTT